MRHLHDLAGTRATTQVVFLPGVYDEPEEFARRGFVERLRRVAPSADVRCADAHIGYFDDGSLVARLHADVVAEGLARGVEATWLVGISLGGLAAMLYAERHAQVAGIVALAPYVGTRDTLAEVRAAGGLANWRADASRGLDWERRLLAWLQGFARGEPRPPMWLGYGRDDRFADSLDMLAADLPRVGRIVRDGGHAWDTWTRLWDELLAGGVGARIGARA